MIRITRVTTSGNAASAAISPDGKYLAYVVNDSGQQSLWIRQIATSSNIQIVPPADARCYGLTFSPDGNYVYYISTSKGRSALNQVPSLGGPVRRLMDGVGGAVAFSPDSKQIAFVRGAPDQGESVLVIANLDGTGERKLATRKSPDFFSSVAWSPDRKVIACGAGGFDHGRAYQNVVQVTTEDGKETTLSSRKWYSVSRLVWLADGSGLMMLASDQILSPTQVWQLTYPAGEARKITNDLSNYQGLSLTPNSTAIVTAQTEQLSSVWAVPNRDASRAKRVTSGKYDGLLGVSWTPHGESIAYASNASGDWQIWMMEANGGNPKQITFDAGPNFRPSVSPTGQYIVFTSGRTGNLHLWRVNIDGSNPRQLTNGNGEDNGTCSPDGRSVIYTSFDSKAANDRTTLWKVSIDGGSPVQLTKKPSAWPAISPDGKLIACYYRNDLNVPWQMAIIPSEGGEPIKSFDSIAVSRLVAQLLPVAWTPDGQAISYISSPGGSSNIWSQPVAGGAPRQVTDFTSDQIFSFDWSLDHNQLVCARGTLTADVVMISISR